MSGFMAVGGRSNWQVTHNQPPYLAPAKLGCIRWLVIGLDLANVFHSRRSRQLTVIRAWPELPLAAAPPTLRSPSPPPPPPHCHYLDSGAGEEETWGIVDPAGASSSLPALLGVKAPGTIPSNKTTCLWSTCMKNNKRLQQNWRSKERKRYFGFRGLIYEILHRSKLTLSQAARNKAAHSRILLRSRL